MPYGTDRLLSSERIAGGFAVWYTSAEERAQLKADLIRAKQNAFGERATGVITFTNETEVEPEAEGEPEIQPESAAEPDAAAETEPKTEAGGEEVD